MRILRQKIFFERTKEMKETAENFRNFKNNVVSGISDTVKNPGKIGKKIKKTGENFGRIAKSPKLMGRIAKKTGNKLVNYIKKNPRDAAYLAVGNLIPVGVGKVVSEKKGKEAGVAAAGVATALPIGETAIAIDHFARSNAGKTAFKAAGQVIKGSAKDIGKLILKKKLR